MILYHASQQKDLEIINPQPALSNNILIGNYVFATKNRNLALMYLVPKGIVTLMDPSPNKPNIVICTNPNKLLEIDNGGAIYELPSKSFVKSPQETLERYEKVSLIPVKPIKKEVFNSVIRTLISNRIEIRFTNEVNFKKLIMNKNQKDLISKMPQYFN